MVLKPVLLLPQNEMDGPRPSAHHTRRGLKTIALERGRFLCLQNRIKKLRSAFYILFAPVTHGRA